MLIASVDLGCSEEVLTIIGMLSAQNIFYRPKEKQSQADQKKAKFHQPEGDHITLLAVYEGWKNSKFSNPWCYEAFVQARSLRRAQDVRKQLVAIMDRYKLDLVSGACACAVVWGACWCVGCLRQLGFQGAACCLPALRLHACFDFSGGAAGRSYQKIQKAICSGFFFHAARKDPQDGYKTGACGGSGRCWGGALGAPAKLPCYLLL